ncbi:MAG: DUF998 domain-containing protein [Planctomycetota bacterium]
MLKLLFPLWLVLQLDGSPVTEPQNPGVPTVRARSLTADIQFGDSPILKGAWHLNPEMNPDYYVINSSLPYGTQKVTFKSDIDEITFDVEAGNEYDFAFVLDDGTKCHTRIWSRPDPEIWTSKWLLPAGLGTLVFCIGAVAVQRWRSTNLLLWFGIVAPVVFWLITLLGGRIRGDYDHFANIVSQLGEVGSGAAVFTSVSLLILSGLCILFSIGFYRKSKSLQISTLPSLLTLGMPFMTAWAAVFPLRNELHGLADPLALIGMNFGALLTFIAFRKQENLATIGKWSLAGFVFMMLTLVLLPMGLPQEYDGLVQRTWYVGWTIWFVALSIGLLRNSRANVITTESAVPSI